MLRRAGKPSRTARQLVDRTAAVTARVQELALPDLCTYEGSVRPTVTFTIAID